MAILLCPFLSTTSPPRPPPPPPPRLLHARNRSQIISSTLRATRQLLSLSSGHLQWPLCRSPPPHLWSGPFSVIATLHAGARGGGGRGGSHHSDAAVIPRLAVCTPDSRATLDLSANQKKNRLYFPSPRVRSAAVGAIWAALCYHPYAPHPCGGGKKTEAESGGAAEAALARACVRLRAALLNERSHPSSVSMLCLFPPSSQSLHALLLIIGPTGTVGRVCVCVRATLIY